MQNFLLVACLASQCKLITQTRHKSFTVKIAAPTAVIPKLSQYFTPQLKSRLILA